MKLIIENIITRKEAVQFDGNNYDEVFKFMDDGGKSEYSRNFKDQLVRIHTLEGVVVANKSDYIIKGLEGEFYPCKPDIFKKSYKIVEMTESFLP